MACSSASASSIDWDSFVKDSESSQPSTLLKNLLDKNCVAFDWKFKMQPYWPLSETFWLQRADLELVLLMDKKANILVLHKKPLPSDASFLLMLIGKHDKKLAILFDVKEADLSTSWSTQVDDERRAFVFASGKYQAIGSKELEKNWKLKVAATT